MPSASTSRERSDEGSTGELLIGDLLGLDGVLLDEVLPVGRNIRIHKDRVDRALWFAQTTVDALVWVDIDHVIAFVDAVDWANSHTGLVFDADARLGNNVWHPYIVPIAEPVRHSNEGIGGNVSVKVNNKRR